MKSTIKKAAKSSQATAKRTGRAAAGLPVSIGNMRDYEAVMARIDKLIEIPDDAMTKQQATELHKLAKAAQLFEKSIYTIKPPSTFEGVLEMKMYEMKLSQGEMAKKLHVSGAKLSLILSGKQKPDISFVKTVHEQLRIDGNYLLSVL